MMGLGRSLAGMITVELVSADIAGTLAALSASGVPVFSVTNRNELTARFVLSRRDYQRAAAFAQKRGESLRVLGRTGLYWDLRQFLHRPVLVIGLSVLIALAFFVPSRVFFVRVEGNSRIPTRKITEAAELCGIGFGASRREVRSEKVKNALLSAVPELQWAGVNTRGCTATISVREREAPQTAQPEPGISSIAASRDGVILSCTVTRGNSLCAPGQAVKEGQTLISAYTDCGLCITAVPAEGEIMALTGRDLTVCTPSKTHIRGTASKKSVKFSLIIGKNRINFYKGSGISDTTCGKMYSKYVLTLPGGFELPMALAKETAVTYDHTAAQISEEAANGLLQGFADRYLRQQMVAGSITDRIESITLDGGVYCLTGEYACTEMIGRRQQEEIGEIP